MAEEQKSSDWWARGLSLFAIAVALGSAGIAYWSTDVSIETAQRSLRAYLTARARDAHIKFDKSGELVVGYEITNVGQTPAYKVKQVLFVNILPKSPARSSPPSWSWSNLTAYMGPSLSIGNLKTRRFTPKEVEHIKAGTEPRLHFVGRITYKDIYRITRCLDFCFMYVGGNSGAKFAYCPTFNDADYDGCKEPKHPPK
jgi:hypothetical protein